MEANEDVDALRAEIEALDSGLIRLLARRFALVRRLGRWKARRELPVESPAREAELRALYRKVAETEGVDPALVLALFRLVHAHSRAQQEAEGRRPD